MFLRKWNVGYKERKRISRFLPLKKKKSLKLISFIYNGCEQQDFVTL